MIPTPGKENLISLLGRSVSLGLMADCAAVTVLLALSLRCLVFSLSFTLDFRGVVLPLQRALSCSSSYGY